MQGGEGHVHGVQVRFPDHLPRVPEVPRDPVAGRQALSAIGGRIGTRVDPDAASAERLARLGFAAHAR